ncbi:21289_t:CDS:2, partial [Gigaspora rosea]
KEPEDKRELTHVKVDPFHSNKAPITWINGNQENRSQAPPKGTWENRLRARGREDAPPIPNLGGIPDLIEEVEKEETAINKDKSVREGRTYQEWLKTFVDYEETEDRPPQEDGHVVEVYQLAWWNMDEEEEEDYYWNEEQGSEEREYLELVQDPSDDEIDWEEYY